MSDCVIRVEADWCNDGRADLTVWCTVHDEEVLYSAVRGLALTDLNALAARHVGEADA